MGLGHNTDLGHDRTGMLDLGYNGTGTQYGSGTQSAQDMGLGHMGPGTVKNWDIMGLRYNGSVTEGPGTQWDRDATWTWDTMGLEHTGTGAQCTWDTTGLEYN